MLLVQRLTGGGVCGGRSESKRTHHVAGWVAMTRRWARTHTGAAVFASGVDPRRNLCSWQSVRSLSLTSMRSVDQKANSLPRGFRQLLAGDWPKKGPSQASIDLAPAPAYAPAYARAYG